MTKSELVRALADRFSALTIADASAAVDVVLGAMTACLAHGKRIEIRDFGSFALNFRPPRLARNPKSGARVEVAAKHMPHFRAGKALRIQVNATRPATAGRRPKYTLNELLAQCDGSEASPRVPGWDTLTPVGKEIL